MTLAKKIGAVRTRRVRTGKNEEEAQKQIFHYLIVLDFESTCWENKASSAPPEVIEFPAVLVEVKSGKILQEFHHYVMPTEMPKLSEFCKKLTGISQVRSVIRTQHTQGV